MSDPYIGEIRMFAETFVPEGWILCDGRTLSIGQYAPLATLLGTTYGGDGRTNFCLPNLVGRVPMQQGQGAGLTYRQIGVAGGASTVNLTSSQIAIHTHNVMCKNSPLTADTRTDPTGNVWSGGSMKAFYGPNSGTLVPMDPRAVGATGADVPVGHYNLQPYLGVYFAIAYEGVWPVQP